MVPTRLGRSGGGWVDAQLVPLDLRRTGDPVQIKHWSQSAVLRCPTTDGDLYAKAVISEIAGEPSLLAVLAERFADYVPTVVATDKLEQRWLTLDFGGTSGWDLPGERTGCLATFAELQVGCVETVDALAASGCRSRMPEDLAAEVGSLLARDDVWHDRSLPRSLTEHEWQRFRTTITHGDFEPLNVVRTKRCWLIHDWTFAAIGHPFYDLACWLNDCDEAESRAAVTTYLDAWLPYAGRSDIAREWAAAKPVGGLAELLKFVRICDAVERDQWFSRTPMLFGWARRLIRSLETDSTERAGW